MKSAFSAPVAAVGTSVPGGAVGVGGGLSKSVDGGPLGRSVGVRRCGSFAMSCSLCVAAVRTSSGMCFMKSRREGSRETAKPATMSWTAGNFSSTTRTE